MLNSDGETDDEDTGYASQTAEAGWSMTTQSILNADFMRDTCEGNKWMMSMHVD